MTIKLKKCSKCGESKQYSEFYKHKLGIDGIRADCKKCCNISSKKWNINNREKIRSVYNYWNTGVTSELYTEFLNLHDDKCAICKKTTKENHKSLAIDHDHKTMKIRGLLCNRCNLGIGYLEDNVAFLKSAIEYINNPPLINKNIDYKPRKSKMIK
jgi:hypothetical protein